MSKYEFPVANRRPAPAALDFPTSEGISKPYLGVIRSVHEAFVRALASSLSLYLRSLVSGDLIGIEQPETAEFEDPAATATGLVSFGMQPFEGHTLVEVSPSLLSPIVEFVLGGNGRIRSDLNRELTDAERTMLEGFFRIVAGELTEAWRPVAEVAFSLDPLETTLQLAKSMARSGGIVAVTMELRVGDMAGTLKLAIPSLALRAMRQPRGRRHPEVRQALAERLMLTADCALLGATLRIDDLLRLQPGMVIDLGIPLDRGMTLLVNGVPKFSGSYVGGGPRPRFVVGGKATPK